MDIKNLTSPELVALLQYINDNSVKSITHENIIKKEKIQNELDRRLDSIK